MRLLRPTRNMVFFSLAGADAIPEQERFLLCKSGEGYLGHEIGLIYASIPDYLLGYGAKASHFDVFSRPYSEVFETDEPVSIWWPLLVPQAVYFHGHFDPTTCRLTVETQKSAPAQGMQIFFGPNTLTPNRAFRSLPPA